LKIVRAATEKNDGVSMKEALAQLKYTTSDVDVVELKVNWERYSKFEKKMQDAIAAGNEAAVKEIVDEWDFAGQDPCVVLGRKFLAGELKKEAPKPQTPPKPAEKPAENDDEYSDDHEDGPESPSSGQVSVKSHSQQEDAQSETNDFEAESEDD
jgi:hypothetical protein